MTLTNILNKVKTDIELNHDEIITLLEVTDPEEKTLIFSLAEALTLHHLGPEIHLRGLIEFSNYCVRQCNYCGLRHENYHLSRYRMTPEEIITTAEQIADLGLKTVVLQSGEDLWFTQEIIKEIILEIKKRTDLAITLSLGERRFTELEAWRKAGADRYLLKQETVNPKIFAEIKPDASYEKRFAILEQLQALGYQVGSGAMIALPGQSLADLANDLIFIRDQRIGMAGFGPFIPHEATPYGHLPGGSGEFSILLLAVARLVLKKVHLPATTALASLVPNGLYRAIQVGANVIMPNMTPLKYRKLYQIYPGKAVTSLEKVMETIHSLGRVVGHTQGDVLVSRICSNSGE